MGNLLCCACMHASPCAGLIALCLMTVQNELMTPTFKLKRPQLQKKYQGIIDDMYKQLNSKH